MMMRSFLVFAFIFFLGFPAAAFAAKKLPPGFIAISASEMTWTEAKTYCQQRGGRLPLIGGSESLAADAIRSDTPIDGFGVDAGPWPARLPSDSYWTGTVNSNFPGSSFIVTDTGGSGDVSTSQQSDTNRVVCVR